MSFFKKKDRKKIFHEELRKKLGFTFDDPSKVYGLEKLNTPQSFSKRLDLKKAVSVESFDSDAFISVMSKGAWSSHLVVVNKIIFTMRWVENTYSYSRFADGIALTNGIKLTYDFGENTNDLFTNNVIQDLGDFFQVSGHNTKIIQDTDATIKGKILISEISLDEIGGIILDLGRGDKINYSIENSLLTYTNMSEFSVRNQGIGWMIR